MVFLSKLNKRWQILSVSFILGALGALGFAPLFLFPLLLVTLCAIWFLLEQDIKKEVSVHRIFWLGWFFGLGHFTVGLYWITYALTVDLAAFWWLIPFALFGIPSILAVFTGVSFILAARWPFYGMSRAIAFAVIWVAVEWLRGHLFTGFPWNLLGYSWAFSPEMMQVASVFGVYGLSLLTLLMAVTLGYVFKSYPLERKIVLGVYLITGFCWIWGKGRLNDAETLPPTPIAIRIVQPNISQALKWNPEQKEANFKKLLEMTAQPSSLSLKAIIWPESAVPFFLEQDPSLRHIIAESLPKGSLLFTGALRRTDPGIEPIKVWNSLLVLNDQGDIISHYDKSHLVPFGEYLPVRNFLDSIFGQGTFKKITAGSLDFTPGFGPETISLPNGLPAFSGLVCYEAIFPCAVVSSSKRPGWMINVTNDAWYGDTSGPYQHYEITRFRAIEEGIPLVRAANSGVSALFDAYGRAVGKINLNREGILDVLLPSPTLCPPPYARWGDGIILGLLLGTLVIAWVISLKRKIH